MAGQGKWFKQPLACRVARHKDLKQSVSLFFGLFHFQGILYAFLYSNRPSNHEAMEGRSRRDSRGNHTRH